MELTLFVDHQCNLRCTYCYNGEKFTKKMSRETMREAVSLAMKSARVFSPGPQAAPDPRAPSSHDGLDVAFFGGEPLLHPDFVEEAAAHVEAEVARLAPGMPLSFVMNTNGTLLGDEALRVMRAPRRFTVNVSVDGPAEVHDKVRLTKGGKGSFDVVAKGLGRLREAGIPYQILSVVRPEGALRLGRTMETVFGLAPRKAQLSIDYSAPWDEAGIVELRAGLAEAGEVWMKLFRAGTALPWNPVHGKILAHLHGGMPCASRCVLGNGEMTVTPSGNIYPCGQMVGEDDDPSLVIGHIDTGIDAEAVKRLMTAKERIDETCGDCGLRDRCQSHCGCRHVALSGELGKVTAVLCETEAAFIDEADRIAEIMVAEKCAAFLGYYYGQQWAPTPGAKLITLRRAAPGAGDRPPPP